MRVQTVYIVYPAGQFVCIHARANCVYSAGTICVYRYVVKLCASCGYNLCV